jgi:DNA-binding transcriptional regulator YiaG
MKKSRRTPLGKRLIRTMQHTLDALEKGERLRSYWYPEVPEPPVFNRERLIRLRKDYSLGQSGLASLLKVSPKTVQSWEQGTRIPSGASLRLLQILESPKILDSLIQAKQAKQSRTRSRITMK